MRVVCVRGVCITGVHIREAFERLLYESLCLLYAAVCIGEVPV